MPRLVYRKNNRTLALVTRAEARLVGAAVAGRQRVDVRGQRHVFVHLRPSQRALLRRRARGSVMTKLVVDGKRVRAYPPLPPPLRPPAARDSMRDEGGPTTGDYMTVVSGQLTNQKALADVVANQVAYWRTLGYEDKATDLEEAFREHQKDYFLDITNELGGLMNLGKQEQLRKLAEKATSLFYHNNKFAKQRKLIVSLD